MSRYNLLRCAGIPDREIETKRRMRDPSHVKASSVNGDMKNNNPQPWDLCVMTNNMNFNRFEDLHICIR